ncbi:MAG: hypothetical protein JRJ20_01740 [Deltaproteobacteria bacterium]|nr:hypothetical protein [Deltaproteobacteria bacterium]
MTVVEAHGYYFPPDFMPDLPEFSTRTYEEGDVTVHLKIPSATPGLVAKLAEHLKENRGKYLAHMPIERIVNVLDEASQRWLDKDYPYRKLALQTIPVITGFSPEAIEASIDVEMESSLKHDMWKALHSEIKNPLYLDDFQYSDELEGYCRAYGPELVVSFFSENIPSLPHLLFMRSALIKAACLGKVASGEPTFAALYLKTIEDIDPEMAGSMAVLYWQGGDEALEEAVFSHADAAVIFGSIETCASLVKRIPPQTKALVHGHKMGFGVIGKNRLSRHNAQELAAAVAYDHAMFDQQACLAPQVYYLENSGEVSPGEFARALADAMSLFEEKMPRGKLSAGEAALINQIRGRYEIRELNGEDVRIHASPRGTAWTVIYEKDPGEFSPSPLNRFVRVWEVDDIFDILKVLKPVGPFLQNAAVSVGDERESELIRRLSELGVTRITSPGNMPLPSLMWHHDGIATLASLLRWCDVEKKGTIGGLEQQNDKYS